MGAKRVDGGRRGTGPNVVKNAQGGGGRRPFYLALLLIVVVGAVALAWVTGQKKTANIITVDPNAGIGVATQGHVLGSATAPVEIVEFADFECPICGQFATVTEPDVRARLINTGQARLRLYAFQINSTHQNSVAAALAAECASDQGKFWEMHDRLFAGQNEWNTLATNDPKPVLAGYAQALGLDMAAYNQCFDSRKHLPLIAANLQEAQRRGANSTPSFIIGDKMLAGLQPYDVIKSLVDSANAKGAR
jgi:protein-disulfide isomerase